jgi:hypothetical protein
MTLTVAIIVVVGAFLRYLLWRQERSGSEQAEKIMPSPAPAASEGMYCPECGVQYRPGFSRCADCDAALVKEKPEKEPDKVYTDLIEVYLTFDTNEVIFIKSLLQEADIPFSIQGERFSNPFAASRAAEMRVRVPKEYEQAARELLTDITNENTDQQEES